MTLKARVKRLETAAKPADDGPRVILFWSDGATVDGETMPWEEYNRRFPGGPGAADIVLNLPWCGKDEL